MKITYEGTEIDLTPSWERLTMIEAVAKYTGVDFAGVRRFSRSAKVGR